MIYFKNKHICSSKNLENNPPPLLALSPGPNKSRQLYTYVVKFDLKKGFIDLGNIVMFRECFRM